MDQAGHDLDGFGASFPLVLLLKQAPNWADAGDGNPMMTFPHGRRYLWSFGQEVSKGTIGPRCVYVCVCLGGSKLCGFKGKPQGKPKSMLEVP